MSKKYGDLGTIIHATMRPEDLIPAFLDALEELDPDRAREIRDDPDNKPWFEHQDLECGDYIVNEDLFDALNEHAPPYCYFGSNEGDGSDYGFWVSSDAIQEAIHDKELFKVTDTGDVPDDYNGEVLHESDHGNLTLYSCKDGKLTEIWSIV